MPRFTFMPMASEAEHAAVGKQIAESIKHKAVPATTYTLSRFNKIMLCVVCHPPLRKQCLTYAYA
jgi:hypothetical protein